MVQGAAKYPFGIRFAVQSRLPFSTRAKLQPPGVRAPFTVRTKSYDVGAYRKVFLDGEYEMNLAKVPNVIVDCGAHIGSAAVWFANRYPGAMILALEPEQSNFALLKRNARTYRNIVPMHAAVWCESMNVDIVDYGTGSWGYRIARPSGSKKTIDSVPSTTIGNLMTTLGIDKIDLLKVDIEGAEKEVFADCAGWIDKVGAIAIEIHKWRSGARESVECAVSSFKYASNCGENAFFYREEYVPPELRARASAAS